MFVPFVADVRINVAVVALGDGDRLRRALQSLVEHECSEPFTITCVINPDFAVDPPLDELPDGIRLIRPKANLGWAGGLHAARRATNAELFAWVQEDMTVNPGWLDALVDAANAHPDGGTFGAVSMTPDGQPVPVNAGEATPFDDVGRWNETDRTATILGVTPTEYDWVASRGSLTRLAAWDDVSGTDPRYFPLNHADKDFCTHLRAHGWKNYLVPGATLLHEGHTSAPSFFRGYLSGWQEPRFNERWGPVLTQLARGASPVMHLCADWKRTGGEEVELAIAVESSRLIVPFARAASHQIVMLSNHRDELLGDRDILTAQVAEIRNQQTETRAAFARLQREVEADRATLGETRSALDEARTERDAAQRDAAELRASRSWRATRPLRRISRLLRRSPGQ